MKNITVTTKTNGYKAEGIQGMIGIFEKAAAKLFPGCIVRHFYYGDKIDMADVVLGNGKYAHFSIAANLVSLSGYTCSREELEKFVSMTHNDEYYGGKLLEITA